MKVGWFDDNVTELEITDMLIDDKVVSICPYCEYNKNISEVEQDIIVCKECKQEYLTPLLNEDEVEKQRPVN